MLATIAQKEVEIQEGKVQLEGLAVALATLKNEMERKLEIPKLVMSKLEMPKPVTYTQATQTDIYKSTRNNFRLSSEAGLGQW